ncbi:EXS family-domain-containing protein [Butyriboletus roseoflavus]|nr:EXS family-domain-containing protein [Butyriboletus roseoflavus]
MIGRRGFVDTFNLGRRPLERKRRNGDHVRSRRKFEVATSTVETVFSTASSETLSDSPRFPRERWNTLPSLSPDGRKHSLDPHEYQHAKRQLRYAVIEHYRGLEVLNNYRVVNLTGFRKALTKYEKITKISVMDAYVKEKVEPSAFGSGTMVSVMLKEVETLFARQFEHGDTKKAMNRLRVGSSSKTHHSSIFRSGLWLGLAFPAIAGASYLCFQEHTRGSLPSWNILVYIYSVFVIPVFLALLIGINVLVWAETKISYVFILRLDLRSRLDHREYFELPSFLLCTLAYAFWFSLAQIGPSMLWPLIWLALALVVMFNPLRSFMWGPTRRWIIKTIAKLGASGVWEAEFADIWLGDQFCSLAYSLSNLYFVGCFYTQFSISLLSSAYAPHAQEAWLRCGSAQNWGWYYVLGMLPFMIRCVQSLRRYWDSRLPSQLINAGKYAMGMISYFFYCYWRYRMSPRTGNSYILWCFTASANAIYGCVWDFTMDWGMCKPRARYPLLRPELVYKSQIPVRSLVSISSMPLTMF